ncbi:hypothetical protein CHARACLAT_018521 [Characodon lateralis]|uniref:Uncharacterized protein n=1 Tax=Characodon lateralis TaxID=208331 RepID=A0ABU7EVZ1_9TELE|nr:hypothetical protein [Characodon lateralis]
MELCVATKSCTFTSLWANINQAYIDTIKYMDMTLKFGINKGSLSTRTRRLPLIRDRVAGAADSAEMSRRPSPQTPPPVPPGGAQGVPRPAEGHGPSSVSWGVPGPPPGGTCLEHLPRKASRRHPV